MSTVDELNNIATDQKDNLIWEEVNDGEYLLEINSDFYVYEVVLNNTEHGKFNWRDYPVILHRYKFSDQTKPLDTRHGSTIQVAAYAKPIVKTGRLS
jgi:hypothetical protein